MSAQCKATTKSGREIVQCTEAAGHPGEHQGYADDYRTIVTWPPHAAPAITQPVVTLDELLEYLGDLMELAAAEGFVVFGALIAATLEAIAEDKARFARRVDPLPPSPARPPH